MFSCTVGSCHSVAATQTLRVRCCHANFVVAGQAAAELHVHWWLTSPAPAPCVPCRRGGGAAAHSAAPRALDFADTAPARPTAVVASRA